MDSLQGDSIFMLPGFPIRTSPGHSSFGNSPEHFAAYNVLLRLSAPRHPPCALHSLISIPLLRSLRASKDGQTLYSRHLISFKDLLAISQSLTVLPFSIAFFCSVVKAANQRLRQSARAAYTRNRDPSQQKKLKKISILRFLRNHAAHVKTRVPCTK